MTTRRAAPVLGVALSASLSLLLLTATEARQPALDVAIDPDDIGGVVAGPNGPEAAVNAALVKFVKK